MFKRLISALMIVMLLSLSGCSRKNSDYEEPEKRVYVSALGFDREGEKIKVIAETINIAQNTSTNEYGIKRYIGEGDSVEAAVFDIKKDLVPTPNLSHCGVLVVGREMTENHFLEMVEYCFWEKELTQSVQLVATEKAEKLLSLNKDSGKPLGFRISELLYEDIDGIGSFKDTTLISVVNDLEGDKIFHLPYFAAEDKECVHTGWEMYKGETPEHFLVRYEMQLLKIVKNDFHSGQINLPDDGRVISLKNVKSTLRWDSTEGGKLKISLKAKTDSENLDVTKKEKAISKEITNLISALRKEDIDLFNIKEKIKSAYPNLKNGGVEELFKTAPIEVDCGIREDEKR